MLDPATNNRVTLVSFGEVVERVSESDVPTADDSRTYIGLEHLDSDSFTIRRWGSDVDIKVPKTRVRKGDVLFARRNTHLRRCAVAPFDAYFSPDGYAFRSKSDTLLHELLLYVVASDDFMSFAIEHSAGTHSKRVKWSDLQNYKFTLPPLEEQRRLADGLAAVESTLDSLLSIGSQAELLLQASIDKVALTAKEEGSLIPLQGLVQEGRPITYGILKPGTGFPGGVPVIKVRDYPEGRVIEDGLLRTDPKIDQEYARSRLRAGDLLISIRGTVGRLAFVPKYLEGANITQDTARLSLRPEYNRHYIRAIIDSSFVQTQVAAFVTGLAVQGINIGELRRVLIPVVQRDHQAELVREVTSIRESIRAVEDRTYHLRSVRSRMLRELQERAR